MLEFDGEEYARFLDEEVRGRMGISAQEFAEQYLAGRLDDADPDVPLLAGLLLIGQNGHRPAAEHLERVARRSSDRGLALRTGRVGGPERAP